MQLPIGEGGLTVHHPESYYFAAQLQHLMGCETPGGGTPNGRIMLSGTLHNTIIDALETDSFCCMNLTTKIIIKIWKRVKKHMGYWVIRTYSTLEQ